MIDYCIGSSYLQQLQIIQLLEKACNGVGLCQSLKDDPESEGTQQMTKCFQGLTINTYSLLMYKVFDYIQFPFMNCYFYGSVSRLGYGTC